MRIVQVGVGSFGRSWLDVARAAAGVEVVAVVDPDAEARTWAAREIGLPSEACFASVNAILRRDDWEAALVVTPPETHRTLAEAILRAGRHVLLEKPLATTLDDARALVEVADATGRILMVSQNYRFRRPARAVQGLVAVGAIGDVLAVGLSCRRDTRRLFPPGGFRYLMRHPYLLDMAIHHIDLLRAVTGRNVTRAYARSWRVPDSPYVHDPAVVAVLTLDGGATVTYEGDWATHDAETSWNGEWELVGERGRVLWSGGKTDSAPDVVLLHRWDAPPEEVEQPALAALDRAGSLLAFRDAVASGRQPETSAADNFQSLAVVLACVESIERGEAVAVADRQPA